jgi:hypothetical protein
MEDLILLKTSVQIGALHAKISLSLDEIKQNHPNRKDLIDSMSASLKDVKEIHRVFIDLENEYRIANKSLFRLELINLDLKNQVIDLKKQINFKDIDL